MFVYFRHGVSGFPLIVPICFSDLKDFPPKLFNARRYLPFVHRVQNCDPQMHKLPPSGIPTVFAVSNRINDFGKLRANRGQLWTSRLLSYSSSLRHWCFLLHAVNSLAFDAEFELSRARLPTSSNLSLAGIVASWLAQR
jgi:hypothetical protein